MMSPDRLAAIKELHAAATPGPWTTEPRDWTPRVVDAPGVYYSPAHCHGSNVADPAFIAISWEAVRDLVAEVERLYFAIRTHRDQKGDDRCWLDDIELYKVLGEAVSIDVTGLPPRCDFLESCRRYYEQRRHPDAAEVRAPDHMTMSQLTETCRAQEAEIDRLCLLSAEPIPFLSGAPAVPEPAVRPAQCHEMAIPYDSFDRVFKGARTAVLSTGGALHRVGDYLRIREYNDDANEASGRWVMHQITDVFCGTPALRQDCVMLSLGPQLMQHNDRSAGGDKVIIIADGRVLS